VRTVGRFKVQKLKQQKHERKYSVIHKFVQKRKNVLNCRANTINFKWQNQHRWNAYNINLCADFHWQNEKRTSELIRRKGVKWATSGIGAKSSKNWAFCSSCVVSVLSEQSLIRTSNNVRNLILHNYMLILSKNFSDNCTSHCSFQWMKQKWEPILNTRVSPLF